LLDVCRFFAFHPGQKFSSELFILAHLSSSLVKWTQNCPNIQKISKNEDSALRKCDLENFFGKIMAKRNKEKLYEKLREFYLETVHNSR
ncbi:Hypothetical predicted protein, partial [Paramuricea clavata]